MEAAPPLRYPNGGDQTDARSEPLMMSETPVITKIDGILSEDGAPPTASLPKFLRIRCQTTMGQFGLLDVLISESAAQELAQELAKHLQASGSP
jgi:hypothetical protein